LTSLKLTAFRIAVLLVCLGFSITKPQLIRRTKIWISVISIFYFVAEVLDEYYLVIQTLGQTISSVATYFILFLIVAANLVFFAWIFYSLFHTMKELRLQGETVKYAMYKKLAITLICCAVGLAVIFIVQFAMTFANLQDPLWRFWWFWDTYWEFIYFIVITVIVFIWRPNSNNQRYAYELQVDEKITEMENRGSVSQSEQQEQQQEEKEEEQEQESE